MENEPLLIENGKRFTEMVEEACGHELNAFIIADEARPDYTASVQTQWDKELKAYTIYRMNMAEWFIRRGDEKDMRAVAAHEAAHVLHFLENMWECFQDSHGERFKAIALPMGAYLDSSPIMYKPDWYEANKYQEI